MCLSTGKPPKMNPVVEPLSGMLGTWLSVPLGAGTYPTLQPFQYLEEVLTSCKFNSFHPDTRRPLHRQCGFIHLKPDTNKVAFVSTQNTGVVEVEKGEVNGQKLCIMSHSIARISFTMEPHVEQVISTSSMSPLIFIFRASATQPVDIFLIVFKDMIHVL
uniref:THAP4-like heme-binding domain-containing protein n=1 Tax=Sciurus vulgaris TaxID=55149 RepID=A0A8D2DCM2_SCIVU